MQRSRNENKNGGLSVRLLICAGGTGGGVYPALAVLQSLKENKQPEVTAGEILWVGSKSGMEVDIVQRAGIPFQGIHAAGLHGVGLAALPGNIVRLLRGFFEARALLRNFRPDVMFFTGGYVAAPVALAGWSRPSVVYVPDIEPGLTLKLLARLADAIAVTAPPSETYLPQGKELQVTGYPVRPSLKRWEKESAFQALELTPGEPVLLVFGGSKGARSLNRALLGCVEVLVQDTQVIHITGKLDWPEVQEHREGMSLSKKERYRAFPYLYERMGAALTAADLAVSRAGASVLGEFPSFELPAILVPYPYAWRYQKVNADYLADHGAAVIIRDEELDQQLLPRVRELLQDREKRQQMGQRMSDLAQPDAAAEIAHLLWKVGQEKGDRR